MTMPPNEQELQLKVFLQSFCLQPRSLPEIVDALSARYSKDERVRDWAIAKVIQLIRTGWLVSDEIASWEFEPDFSDTKSRFRTKEGKGFAGGEEFDFERNPITIDEFRAFLEFLSFFYDVASGTGAIPVNDEASLLETPSRRLRRAARAAAAAGDTPDFAFGAEDKSNDFSLVRNISFASNGEGLGFSAQIRLKDKDFVLLSGAKFNEAGARAILGAPLLVMKNIDPKAKSKKAAEAAERRSERSYSLVPVFYFSLTGLKLDVTTRVLSCEQVVGPFFNKGFEEYLPLAMKGVFSKSECKSLLSNFSLEAARILQSNGAPEELWEKLNQAIFTFFSERCLGVGPAVGLSAFGEFQEISSLERASARIVNQAVVSLSTVSTFNRATSKDFKAILEASDEELMQSALSCFFADPRKEAIRAAAAAPAASASAHGGGAGALDFNAFGVDSQAALVLTLGAKYEPDEDQERAVRSMLKNDLTVLQGPPGTGKTMTVTTAALNHLVRGQKVLVTSQNHAAIKAFFEKLVFDLVVDCI